MSTTSAAQSSISAPPFTKMRDARMLELAQRITHRGMVPLAWWMSFAFQVTLGFAAGALLGVLIQTHSSASWVGCGLAGAFIAFIADNLLQATNARAIRDAAEREFDRRLTKVSTRDAEALDLWVGALSAQRFALTWAVMATWGLVGLLLMGLLDADALDWAIWLALPLSVLLVGASLALPLIGSQVAVGQMLCHELERAQRI